MLIQVAWKNIWRNKTRSLVIMGSVVMGLWVGAFMMAYAFGMIDQRLEDAVKNEVSHFQIHHPLYNRDYEVKYAIPKGDELLEQLQHDNTIEAVSGRVVVYGMVSSAATGTGGKFMGIDPEKEDLVTGLKTKLTSGDYFEENKRNQVIISERLAEKLKVRLRSKIILTMQDSAGTIVAGAFRIIALYRTYNSSYDLNNIFLRSGDLSRLINMPGQYHEIAALMSDPDQLDYLVTSNSNPDKGILYEGWKDISPELGIMIDSFDQYMIIFLVIILLALSFGIINTMLMAVLERVREIGMLMAIGMNRWKLFLMIAIESFALVVTAAPLGLLLAYSTVTYLGSTGLDLSAIYQEGYESYGFKTYIYPKLENVFYVRITVLVIVTAILASIYPALTAIRLDPIKAIRKI